jgi:hypothetical protein
MSLDGDFETQSTWDELRRDKVIGITEWLRNNNPSTATDVTHKDSVAVQWSFQLGATVDGGFLKELLQVGYSETRTFENTYKGIISPGQTGRMIYTPNMHCIRGLLTTYRLEMVGDVLVRGDVNIDHVLTEIFFPIDGGEFSMEYRG